MPVQAPVSNTASQNRAAAECRSVAGILSSPDAVASSLSIPGWHVGLPSAYPYYDGQMVETTEAPLAQRSETYLRLDGIA